MPALMKLFPPLVVLVLLAGCKAQKVEVHLIGDDLIAASTGHNLTTNFEAEIGEESTTIDDPKRAMIDRITALLPKYFPDADQTVEIGGDAYSIRLAGSLPLADGRPADGTPWFVQARKSTDGPGIVVSLEPSASYGNFKAEMQQIDAMISPDEYHPLEFQFTASSGTILVGGAMIDDKSVGIARIPMSGQTVNMLFENGVWDETSGTFIYIP